MDKNFLKGLFGVGPVSPCPRKENHYMYAMTQRMEIPITSQADGTVTVIIQPYSSIFGGYAANSSYLPFIQVSANNSQFPYNAAGSYNQPGPFNNQLNNIITYGIDTLALDFINTQSAINCQGRLNTSFFY